MTTQSLPNRPAGQTTLMRVRVGDHLRIKHMAASQGQRPHDVLTAALEVGLVVEEIRHTDPTAAQRLVSQIFDTHAACTRTAEDEADEVEARLARELVAECYPDGERTLLGLVAAGVTVLTPEARAGLARFAAEVNTRLAPAGEAASAALAEVNTRLAPAGEAASAALAEVNTRLAPAGEAASAALAEVNTRLAAAGEAASAALAEVNTRLAAAGEAAVGRAADRVAEAGKAAAAVLATPVIQPPPQD